MKYLDVQTENYIIINRDSFEFSYSGCILYGQLRRMGRILSELGVGKFGFIRQKNKAYAFLSYDEIRSEDEQVLIEFVDCSTLNLENENQQDFLPEWVRFYRKIELSTTYMSIKGAENIFGKSLDFINEEVVVFLVELKYRYIDIGYFESDNRYDYISDEYHRNFLKENTCIVEHLYAAGSYQPKCVDLVDIKAVDIISGLERESVLSKFDIEIEPYIGLQYNENIIDRNENTKYTFTVHNVGQALATSFKEEGKQDFFYFDYGIPFGRNKFTLPTKVELPIAEGATILLSHVHEDHWCGFRINPDALKCRWIIPQKPTKALAKVLSSVYLSGGSISLYQANGLHIFRVKSINNCMVAGNTRSKLKPLRAPKSVHENGNALYIFAEYEGMECKIVVSGDQDYDYQDSNYLNDINILVACHHGGKYSWSKSTAVPKPNVAENKIIYSYGDRNTYGHPAKGQDYVKNGWKTEYHIPQNGDYKIDLELIDNTSLVGAIKASNPSGMEFEV